jgi:hypothetical protein
MSNSTYPNRLFLDVSTAHLRPSTRSWLDAMMAHPEENRALGSCGKMPHGWFCHAPESLDGYNDVPLDLVRVLEMARARGCEYVLFDADAGPCVLDLPVFDDEPAPQPNLRRWRVELSAEAKDGLRASVVVEAATASAAETLAMNRANDGHVQWEHGNYSGTPENIMLDSEPRDITESELAAGQK